MSLSDAINKFAAKIEDLTTLEVTTYTGTLSQALTDGGEIDWDKFKPSSGELLMVAATRISADFDTVNFRAQMATNDQLKDLLLVHQAAVETAQNGRLGLLKMFTNKLG